MGTVIKYNDFDPYGTPIENGGDPYGYTGEWWEDELGLLHLRARWYMPEVGIFLSRDPVDGEPPYLYVRGNPLRYNDPSGLIGQKPRFPSYHDWLNAGGFPIMIQTSDH